jgi:hypothetical protein
MKKLFIILSTSIFMGCVQDTCQEMGEREALKVLGSKGLLMCARERIWWDEARNPHTDTTLEICREGAWPNAILDTTQELSLTIVFKRGAKK